MLGTKPKTSAISKYGQANRGSQNTQECPVNLTRKATIAGSATIQIRILSFQNSPRPIFFLIFFSTFIFDPFLSLTGVVSDSRAIGGSTNVGGGPEARGQAGQWQPPRACLTLIQPVTPIIWEETLLLLRKSKNKSP